MSRQSAHDGEASGLAVGAAAVRLRLSPVERLVHVGQWLLGVAGAVVVLWVGAAFLAATPAAAGVPAPMAASQSLQKGGITRLMSGGKDRDSDSGGSDDDHGSDDKKSDKGKSEKKKSEKKKSDEKSDKKSDEKKSGEKDDKERSTSAKDSVEHDESDDHSDGDRSDSDRAERPSSAERHRTEKKAAEKTTGGRHSARDRDDADERSSADEEGSEARRERGRDGDDERAVRQIGSRRTRADREKTRTTHDDDGGDEDGDDRHRATAGGGDRAVSEHVRDVVRETLGGIGDGQRRARAGRADDHGDEGAATDHATRRAGARHDGAGPAGKRRTSATESPGDRDDADEPRAARGRERADGDGGRDGGRATTRELRDGGDLAERLETDLGDEDDVRAAAERWAGSAARKAVATRREHGDHDGARGAARRKAGDLPGKSDRGHGDDDAVKRIRKAIQERLGDAGERATTTRERAAARKRLDRPANDEHSVRSVAGRDDDARAVAKDVRKKVEATRADQDGPDGEETGRDEVRRAARKLIGRQQVDARETDRIGDRLVDVVREAASGGEHLDEAVDELADEVSRSARSGDGAKGATERQRGKAGAGVDGVVFDGSDGSGSCPASGDGCGAETSGSRLFSAAAPRGPPSDDGDDNDDDEYDDEDLTEKVLQDRIATDKGAKTVEASRKQVAAGKKTAKEHSRLAAAQRQREADAEVDRAHLDAERVDLVDEVVDGHEALQSRENALAAEAKKVAAGTASAAAHKKDVAAFEADKQELYDKTDELREATGRDAPETVSEDDAGRDGSAAGCGVSGAFAECGAVSNDEARDQHGDESGWSREQGDRCVALAGVSGCGVSSGSGADKASASCDQSSCSSNAAKGANTASAKCGFGSGDCEQKSRADSRSAASDCRTSSGSCETGSSGTRRSTDPSTARDTRLASTATGGQEVRHGSADAKCTAGCGAASEVGFDRSRGATADADVSCDAGCSGSAATDVGTRAVRQAAERTPESSSKGSAHCSVTGGGCAAHGGASAEQARFADRTGAGPVTVTDGEGGASSTAEAGVDCDGGPGCSGKAGIVTAATVSAPNATAGGPAAVRTTTGSAGCDATSGGCSIESSSDATDDGRAERSPLTRAADGTLVVAPAAGPELAASSRAGANVECEAAGCTGSGASTTSGAASGDVKGVRDSTGSSSCTAHGAGVGCAAEADTAVSDRDPATGDPTTGVATVSGPVSVSDSGATVQCTGGTSECGGTASSSTSARDTAVSPHARGTSASVGCTVTGGGCSGQAGSKASSAPDYVTIDPKTGLPVKGQPTSGPSSTSASSAGLDCPAGCTGAVHTSSAAWDGAVAGGKPRTSTGTASCAGTGGCQMQSVSSASTGPGAAQVLNAKRLVVGPSAASAAGAALTCEGQAVCTGKATSAATATDPSVSPNPRGSHSEGSCEGASGGVCQAVLNSAASSGPDADGIAPLVHARSTENATITSGTTGDAEQAPAQQQAPADGRGQPVTPPAPTAPGSSANAGGPTVPGASSWTMVDATFDCAGGTTCSGTVRSSASGSDGPNAVQGAGGARGPPEGASNTSASCATTHSGCQAQTSSSAASGQVVADIAAEQNEDAAEQAQQQAIEAQWLAAQAAQIAARPGATPAQQQAATDAAEASTEARTTAIEAAELAARPVTNTPATLSRSTVRAQCSGPGCTASVQGGASTTAALHGERDPGTVAGSRGTASCTSGPQGCAVTASGTATTETTSGQADPAHRGELRPGRSGAARTAAAVQCPDAGCRGTVSGDGLAAADPKGIAPATLAAANGVVPGKSHLAPPGGTSVSRAHGTTGCSGQQGACVAQLATSASVAGSTAGGGFGITSTGIDGTCETAAGPCATHLAGDAAGPAVGGRNTATAATDCAAGQCRGVMQVGASDQFAAASAGCTAAGAHCTYAYRAESHARTAGAHADAVGYRHGPDGGGQVLTSAAAVGNPTSAQVAASCQGSAGTACSYHYEALRTATARDRASGSHAEARAHGVGGGRMGAGGLAVAATAAAQGNQASATAVCSGHGDCSDTRFHAKAMASVRAPVAATTEHGGGHVDASHWGECGHPGSGGCGVVAVPDPNDQQDGGRALCGGDCRGFRQGGAPARFVQTTPALEKTTIHTTSVGRDGKPLDERPVGKTERGAWAGDVEHPAEVEPGIYMPGRMAVDHVVETTEHGRSTAQACPTNQSCHRGGGNAPYAAYNKDQGATTYETSDVIAPGDSHRDVVYGTTSSGIVRDAKGRTRVTVGGDGYVVDGRSGTTLQVTAPTPTAVNSLRVYDARVPFEGDITGKIDYSGPTLTLPKGAMPFGKDAPRFDHLTTQGPSVHLTAGAGGTVDDAGFHFRGAGTYTTPWGDTLKVTSGAGDVVAPGANGYGGHLRIESDGGTFGDGTVQTHDTVLPHAEGEYVPPTLVCQGCRGDKTGPGIGMYEMPTEPGQGGRNTCSTMLGICGSHGAPQPNGKYDSAEVTFDVHDYEHPGRGEFVQQLRGADGSGGWVVGFANGNAAVHGEDAYGNRVTDHGNGAGIFLGYAEDDRYGAGQACGSKNCTGSDPVERRLPWVFPTADVTKALGLTEQRYNDGDRHQRDLVPGVGRQDLAARAEAVARFDGSLAHTRWMTEAGNYQLSDLAHYAEELNRGGLTRSDRDALAAELAEHPKLLQRAGRTAGAVDAIEKVAGTRPHKIDDVEQQLAGDPALIAAITGHPCGPDKCKQQVQEAKDRILSAQNTLIRIGKQFETDPQLTTAQSAYDTALEKYNAAVETYNAGKGGTPAGLDAQKAKVDRLHSAVNARKKQLDGELAEAQGTLRAYDLAAAGVADPDSYKFYAAGIAQAGRNVAAVEGVVDGLPIATTEAEASANNKIVGFVNSVQDNYTGALVAPRAPTNRLHDLQLPSTLSVDLPLAMRSHQANDYLKGLMDADNSPLITQDALPGGSPDPNEEPRDMTPDELADFGATWVPNTPMVKHALATGDLRLPLSTEDDLRIIAHENGMPLDADDRITLIAGLSGPDGTREAIFGDPRRVATVERFFHRANVVNGSYSALAADMTPEEKGDLDGFADQVDPVSVGGFFDFLGDGADQLAAHVRRTYDRGFGYGTENFLRNLGRDTVDVGTGTVLLPIKLGAESVSQSISLAHPSTWKNPPERLIGESEHDYRSRVAPATMTVSDLVGQTVDVYTGKTDLGPALFTHPIGTSLAAAAPVLILAGGVRGVAGTKGAGYAARGAALRETAGTLPRGREYAQQRSELRTRAGQFERRASTYGVLARGAGVVQQIAAAPLTVAALPLRAAGAAAYPVLAGASRLGRAAGDFAMAQGRRTGSEGVPFGTRWGNTGERLHSASDALARGAESSRRTARYGWTHPGPDDALERSPASTDDRRSPAGVRARTEAADDGAVALHDHTGDRDAAAGRPGTPRATPLPGRGARSAGSDGTREEDFGALAERNRELRQEGSEQVRAMNGGRDPDLDTTRRPNERALTTARYRTAGGEVIDLHSYSGGRGDWRPADETPERPPKGKRLFETTDAAPYDPSSPIGRGSNAWPRGKDSEVTLLEELARRQFEALSGLERHEIDVAIERAARAVQNDIKFGHKTYPEGVEGKAMRAKDRVERTVENLNKIGRRNADRNGTEYSPFTVADIKGDVRLVVDLPSGRADPPGTQVCDSCTDVMLSYRAAFPGIRFEVRNLAQERLHG